MHGSDLAERAGLVSERLCGGLGRRWDHVRGVARRAGQLAPAVPAELRPILVAAAWLHDIGYAPGVRDTGLHPLDGARYLQREGWPTLVVQLVAHHTGARFEAAERGLAEDLASFPLPPEAVLDALTTADLTVGPDGAGVDAESRITEILHRYSPEDPVHRAVLRSRGALLASVAATVARLPQGRPGDQ